MLEDKCPGCGAVKGGLHHPGCGWVNSERQKAVQFQDPAGHRAPSKFDKLRTFLNFLHRREQQWHAFAGPQQATELSADWIVGQIMNGTDNFNWDAINDQP